jgi:type 2 lantibiotic biosynthesis protein LanM
MHDLFDVADWYEAMTLAERASLPGTGAGLPSSGERIARSAQKADRWRKESGLLDDRLFAERLALDGLTPEGFLRILAEPATDLRRRAGRRPAWLRLLERAFSQPLPPLPSLAEGGELGILELLRPLIADAWSRTLEGLRLIDGERPGLLAPETLATALLPALVRRLRWASERALVLELHTSRLEGRLHGETPEDRFRSFVETLRQPGTALAVLRRYPVLARDACRYAEQWVETSLEMAKRFAADRDEIARLPGFGPGPDPWIGVETGLSDRHAGGRSVAILACASGARVVYKPKPLAADRGFLELVAWLNARGAEPPLRCPEVLDRGGYGWAEYVAARSCETLEEVERFYARQGGWLALFYVLEATDFHHENLIAEGEHPVPIDLETLFQPALDEAAAGGLADEATASTVLHSGLLPRRFWATLAEDGIDLSGMGWTAGQAFEVKRITDEGTDRMRWGRQEVRTESGPHLPTLRGEPLVPWDYGEPVLQGFRSLYRLLCLHREDFLSPAGPLAPFLGMPVRTLLRGTSVYAHLLHVGNHPDYLRSALDRDRLYDRLWLEAAGYPPLRRAVPAERKDLSAGDVPRLEVGASATDLLHPGGERIESFFAASGMELVRGRLQAMGEDDLERQGWLVRAALEPARPPGEHQTSSPVALPAAPPAEPERFLQAARDLGDRLFQLAVQRGGLVTWFHLAPRVEGWRLEPMPAGLYSGLAGLALFLGHLGQTPGGERYESLARSALTTIRQRVATGLEPLALPGAFSGWGGIVYALTHLGALWQEPELLDEAAELAVRGMPTVDQDETFDLMAGSTGAAAALLALHDRRPCSRLLAAAIRCGDRLLAGAVDGERGLGWIAPSGSGSLPLTGFSHGTAGIAWVLARLAAASGEERFRAAACGALRYERSWFHPERDNWPDLRAGTEGEEFRHTWCHGAPGIGLGRIATLPYLNDPEISGEIRAAVRATLAEGFGGSQCLCHGDLGNLELVREAGRVLGDGALTAEADRLAARILARIEGGGLRCGTSARTESLGLMTGLAGIGYGLLRAAWPERVPSVLLLETPED